MCDLMAEIRSTWPKRNLSPREKKMMEKRGGEDGPWDVVDESDEMREMWLIHRLV